MTDDWLWLQRSLPDEITGADVWESLYADELITVLLESPAKSSSKLARYSIAAGKPRQIWTPAVGEILSCLKQLQSRMRTAQNSNLDLPDQLPFTGGYLGWLGYDLAWEIERLPYTKPDTLPFPVAFWYEPSSFAVIDHHTQNVWLAASDRHELTELSDRLSNGLSRSSFSELPNYSPSVHTPTYSPEQQGYEAMVETAKQHIYAGDIFQANLSMRFGYPWSADGWELYRHLQHINPSPFASYWRTTWGEVISVSPERLVSLRDRHAETRPIAGTRPRGKNEQQDQQLERELLACIKEQAEHIMLVDLERNDLGRVCEWSIHRLAKAALGGLFVDLGAAGFLAAAHHVNHRLLATHELAHYAVNQAFFYQRLKAFRRFHVPAGGVTSNGLSCCSKVGISSLTVG